MVSQRYHLDIYVEGLHDQMFFNNVVVPALSRRGEFESIQVNYFSGLKRLMTKKDANVIRSSMATQESDGSYFYLLVVDADYFLCATLRKESIEKLLPGIDPRNIIVVFTAIESWYLAGMTEEFIQKWGMSAYELTDTFDKTKFFDIIPVSEEASTPFRRMMLSEYSVDAALKKSKSFSYFWSRFVVGDCKGLLAKEPCTQ